MLNDNALVKIRKLLPTDAAQLAGLCNNKKILDCLRDRSPFPYCESDVMGFIEECASDEPIVRFAIEYQGGFCGCVGFVPQDDINSPNAEVGYWLGEAFWGKGIATAAVNLILEYGFLMLNLKRIYADVFEYNEASKKVLLKNGFKLERVLKSATKKSEVLLDECRFGLTKDDFFKGGKINDSI
jgi:[ribosomal protein S5]-alanine N-acetyltransferase